MGCCSSSWFCLDPSWWDQQSVGWVTSPSFSWKRHRKRDNKPSEFTIDGSYIGVHHKNQPLHGKIGYCPLVMYRFLLFFRVVSGAGDYGKPCFCWPMGKTHPIPGQESTLSSLHGVSYCTFVISWAARRWRGFWWWLFPTRKVGVGSGGIQGWKRKRRYVDIKVLQDEMDIRMRCIQDGKHQILICIIIRDDSCGTPSDSSFQWDSRGASLRDILVPPLSLIWALFSRRRCHLPLGYHDKKANFSWILCFELRLHLMLLRVAQGMFSWGLLGKLGETGCGRCVWLWLKDFNPKSLVWPSECFRKWWYPKMDGL